MGPSGDYGARAQERDPGWGFVNKEMMRSPSNQGT